MNDPDIKSFIKFVGMLLCFLAPILYFTAMEIAKKDRIRRELAQQTSVDESKVLAELLGEVKLMRLAIEKLAGP